MLIHAVPAIRYTYLTLIPHKRSLQPVGPSSFTLLGWFSLPAIDQYSSLLPPEVGRYPAYYLMERTPLPYRNNFSQVYMRTPDIIGY